ncbi:hypothetical protein AWH56_008590 [Anaerobacillus isosaccharinicus]|uniref:Uncharacterized protein n=1 Tax=Anaerobacillus isosaccharinicus TaxID=1532552 RepID=A0A1S2L1B5_9BACI|nr:hypothetical protein [Anaerobacillus isosaccharinicus]MBA5583958.1 hypothetical protein [Anaerobacillus isosaccharinicus]QOY37622.1 hypothetical protein AWH56_008590 [Anaerobacillus isosaccharinicus]
MILLSDVISKIANKCISDYRCQELRKVKNELFLRLLDGEVACVSFDNEKEGFSWFLTQVKHNLHLTFSSDHRTGSVSAFQHRTVMTPQVVGNSEDVLSILFYIDQDKALTITEELTKLGVTNLQPVDIAMYVRKNDSKLFSELKTKVIDEFLNNLQNAFGSYIINRYYDLK